MGLILPVAYGGIAIALMVAWLYPAKPLPPIPRSEAQGCYRAAGWPSLAVTEDAFRIAGLPPRRYAMARYNLVSGVRIEPGITRMANARGGGGSFTSGGAINLVRLRRTTEGKFFETSQPGPIEWLDVAGVVYARTPCPAS